MTINNEKLIGWFTSRIGKLTYSMYGSRNGSDGTADCSGSMTQALYEAGASKYSYLYSTETIHDYLTANGYQLIAQTGQTFNPVRGDICIFGKRGQSAGAGGHIMVFTGTENQISVCYWTQGQAGTAVQEMSFDQMWIADGKPYYYIYRQKNAQPAPAPSRPAQSASAPSGANWIRESATYVPNSNVNLRTSADVNSSSIAIIKGGSQIKYDAYSIHGGYVWIRQPRAGGKYGYLATGNASGGRRTSYWGTFK